MLASEGPTEIIGQQGTYVVCGSMGRKSRFGGIMLATDKTTGKKVSIKRIDRPTDEHRVLLGRLQRTVVNGVSQILDIVEIQNSLYIVREFVEGTDLKTIFTDKKTYGRIDENRWLDVGRSVLRILSAVHSLGIVHRDIKPSNIVLRHTSEADVTKADYSDVVLIDFEQCSAFPPEEGSLHTSFALIYSPPEMVLKRNELVGPQADLFSLAITIYHLVMGKTPYTDCNPEVLINLQLTYPMKKPARMTQALFDVLSRAAYKQSFRLPPRRLSDEEIVLTLRRGIGGRYSSADEMLYDLCKVESALLPASWWQKAFGISKQ